MRFCALFVAYLGGIVAANGHPDIGGVAIFGVAVLMVVYARYKDLKRLGGLFQ